RLAIVPPQDHVRAPDITGVQPDVVTARMTQRERIIRPGIPPDTHLESAAGPVDAVGQRDLLFRAGALQRGRLRRGDLLRSRCTALDTLPERAPVRRLIPCARNQVREARSGTLTLACPGVVLRRVLGGRERSVQLDIEHASLEVVELYARCAFRYTVNLREQQVCRVPQ